MRKQNSSTQVKLAPYLRVLGGLTFGTWGVTSVFVQCFVQSLIRFFIQELSTAHLKLFGNDTEAFGNTIINLKLG